MPNMYKDEYLKNTKFRIWHMHISGLYPQFSIYLGNTRKIYIPTNNIFATIMTNVFGEHHKQKLKCKPTYWKLGYDLEFNTYLNKLWGCFLKSFLMSI
jgi:hypothetical protein